MMKVTRQTLRTLLMAAALLAAAAAAIWLWVFITRTGP
jgi:hypothetical protein